MPFPPPPGFGGPPPPYGDPYAAPPPPGAWGGPPPPYGAPPPPYGPPGGPGGYGAAPPPPGLYDAPPLPPGEPAAAAAAAPPAVHSLVNSLAASSGRGSAARAGGPIAFFSGVVGAPPTAVLLPLGLVAGSLWTVKSCPRGHLLLAAAMRGPLVCSCSFLGVAGAQLSAAPPGPPDPPFSQATCRRRRCRARGSLRCRPPRRRCRRRLRSRRWRQSTRSECCAFRFYFF